MRTPEIIDHILTVTPNPSPSPSAGAGTTLDNNATLAVILIVATVVVIVVALGFALIYHFRLLEVITAAVKKGQTVGTTSDAAVAERALAGSGAAIDPDIVGPEAAEPDSELLFAVTPVPDGSTVTWKVTGGDPSSKPDDPAFVTTFAKAGTYKVTATLTDTASNDKTILKTKVTIAVPAPAGITLPFVVKNWGRLVIVIFGVGLISALIALRALDAAAGVGILGTLLGVGAVAGSSGATAPSTRERGNGGTHTHDDDA